MFQDLYARNQIEPIAKRLGQRGDPAERLHVLPNLRNCERGDINAPSVYALLAEEFDEQAPRAPGIQHTARRQSLHDPGGHSAKAAQPFSASPVRDRATVGSIILSIVKGSRIVAH